MTLADDEYGEFPRELLQLAYVHGYQDGFPTLASLAEAEDWNYQNAPNDRPNPVLTNYVVYTYRRLVDERKISVSPDGQKLCFNTGLVTENQEDIFALFVPNRREGSDQRWFSVGWKKKSDHELKAFSKLPDLAQYYDDPSVLIYDPRLELRVNVDHIIDENRERFPERYRDMTSFELRNFLSGAIDSVQMRVRRNYKTAIPQVFHGRAQLLLPICLSNPRVADLALAVERFENHYRASTCLTLDMAYNNARQLARPDKDWLQP